MITNTEVPNEEDYTVYDEENDPREQHHQKVPLVTGEAPWMLQVSIKTPAGTLINVRGMEGVEVMAGLAAIRSMADEIQGVESLFAVGVLNQGLGATPIRQYQQPQAQPAAPQGQWGQPQAAQQGPAGPAPMCKHGLPAKYVQGGIAKSTGRPYRAFFACSLPREQQCDFRADG